jgi:hypothetical protein
MTDAQQHHQQFVRQYQTLLRQYNSDTDFSTYHKFVNELLTQRKETFKSNLKMMTRKFHNSGHLRIMMNHVIHCNDKEFILDVFQFVNLLLLKDNKKLVWHSLNYYAMPLYHLMARNTSDVNFYTKIYSFIQPFLRFDNHQHMLEVLLRNIESEQLVEFCLQQPLISYDITNDTHDFITTSIVKVIQQHNNITIANMCFQYLLTVPITSDILEFYLTLLADQCLQELPKDQLRNIINISHIQANSPEALHMMQTIMKPWSLKDRIGEDMSHALLVDFLASMCATLAHTESDEKHINRVFYTQFEDLMVELVKKYPYDPDIMNSLVILYMDIFNRYFMPKFRVENMIDLLLQVWKGGEKPPLIDVLANACNTVRRWKPIKMSWLGQRLIQYGLLDCLMNTKSHSLLIPLAELLFRKWGEHVLTERYGSDIVDLIKRVYQWNTQSKIYFLLVPKSQDTSCSNRELASLLSIGHLSLENINKRVPLLVKYLNTRLSTITSEEIKFWMGRDLLWDDLRGCIKFLRIISEQYKSYSNEISSIDVEPFLKGFETLFFATKNDKVFWQDHKMVRLLGYLWTVPELRIKMHYKRAILVSVLKVIERRNYTETTGKVRWIQYSGNYETSINLRWKVLEGALILNRNNFSDVVFIFT